MDALLRDALLHARTQAGGAGATMLGASLGKLLRADGVRWPGKLTQWLQSFPSFCAVEGQHIRFLDGAPEPVSGVDRDAQESTLWLERRLFTAFVKDHQDHFFDLQTTQVVVESEDDQALSDAISRQPLRYLRVPTIPTHEQLDHACSFFEQRGTPDVAARLKAAGAGWSKVGAQQVDAQAWAAFLDARRAWVVQQALPWLRSHNISVERFVSSKEAPASKRSPATTSVSLRATVHRCVDLMTDAELASLSLPARVVAALWGSGHT